MIEIHGWITLRYSDYHSEEAEQNNFLYRFKQYLLQDYAWLLAEESARLINKNGLACFSIDVQHNHAGQLYALEIFRWVSQASTGSYGMLYIHDDEDVKWGNEFQVYVLKRGKVQQEKDAFLSPYEEEVERTYDETDPPLD